MPEFTQERIKELRRIAEKATEGPWRVSECGCSGGHMVVANDTVGQIVEGGFWADEDASHIAAFDPPTVLAILDALEAKCTESDALLETLREANDNRAAMLDLAGHTRKERDEARAEAEKWRKRSRQETLAWIDHMNRAYKAEAALERIKGARANYPECDKYDDDSPITCGWKRTVQSIDAALQTIQGADDA